MRNWTRRTRLLFLFLVAPPMFLLFIALGGHVVRLLWNWLLPPLFGVPEVSFWQALGLLALSRILFGGFHGGSGSRYRSRWEAMTPEERERIRERMREGKRGRWGLEAPPAGSKGE